VVFDALLFAGFGALDGGGYSTALVLRFALAIDSSFGAERIFSAIPVGGVWRAFRADGVAIGAHTFAAPKLGKMGGGDGRIFAIDGLLRPRSADVQFAGFPKRVGKLAFVARFGIRKNTTQATQSHREKT